MQGKTCEYQTSLGEAKGIEWQPICTAAKTSGSLVCRLMTPSFMQGGY